MIINLFILFVTQSDGGGRSGVYLAIDANMELAEEEDAFDVFGYLKKLRQSRRGLIENLVIITLIKYCKSNLSIINIIFKNLKLIRKNSHIFQF